MHADKIGQSLRNLERAVSRLERVSFESNHYPRTVIASRRRGNPGATQKSHCLWLLDCRVASLLAMTNLV